LQGFSFQADGSLRRSAYRCTESQDLLVEWSNESMAVRESLAAASEALHWKVWVARPGDPEQQLVMDDHWHRVAPGSAPKVEAKTLAESLQPLAGFLGTWEVQTTWPSGVSLWARSQIQAAPGGTYLTSRIQAREGQQVEYHRYQTFYLATEAPLHWREITFSYQGTVMEGRATQEKPGQILTKIQNPAGTQIEKELVLNSTAGYHATVRARAEESEPWSKVMDAQWEKKLDFPRRDIEAARFVGASANVRSFEVEDVVDAAPPAVFRAFTDRTAFREAYGPDRESLDANIDLAIGGPYEWLFDGTTGSNDCQVLSYIPNRMLSFSWNAPLDQAKSREFFTWVVVEFSPRDRECTHVRITHLGFGEEEHWDRTYEYFQKAWPAVLNTFKKNLGSTRS
jgi:uncharacterized protein YndB with AHSA1/START domain